MYEIFLKTKLKPQNQYFFLWQEFPQLWHPLYVPKAQFCLVKKKQTCHVLTQRPSIFGKLTSECCHIRIPSAIFLKAFFFHFTSNSLFDFCCVILRFPLICFLLQLRCSSFHSPLLALTLRLKKNNHQSTIYIAKSFIWPHISISSEIGKKFLLIYGFILIYDYKYRQVCSS